MLCRQNSRSSTTLVLGYSLPPRPFVVVVSDSSHRARAARFFSSRADSSCVQTNRSHPTIRSSHSFMFSGFSSCNGSRSTQSDHDVNSSIYDKLIICFLHSRWCASQFLSFFGSQIRLNRSLLRTSSVDPFPYLINNYQAYYSLFVWGVAPQ